ncbi:MAG: AraC family transcriptional regulator, partial [Acidimicrobiales bacterium]
MFGQNKGKSPQSIGFLLLPQFSLIAFTASIEPLRSANRLSRQHLYNWTTISFDGLPVEASNLVTITPDCALKHAKNCDVIFACAGVQPLKNVPNGLAGELRALARTGLPLGSVCTGSVALAKAGLLDGHRCTIHWENIETFAETFPDLEITATLFEIDRKRYTCSGGTAPLDMMI